MSKLRTGQLVWIDNPGFPYEEWDGASCLVENPQAGQGNQYVAVRLVISDDDNLTALFHPETVKPETRPWLKKHLKQFVRMRRELVEAATAVCEKYSEC